MDVFHAIRSIMSSEDLENFSTVFFVVEHKRLCRCLEIVKLFYGYFGEFIFSQVIRLALIVIPLRALRPWFCQSVST